jgi:hypothetical protein
MPKLLTRKQFIAVFGGSRQSVCNRIRRKTLKTVLAPVERQEEMIVVDDDIYEAAVKAKECTP